MQIVSLDSLNVGSYIYLKRKSNIKKADFWWSFLYPMQICLLGNILWLWDALHDLLPFKQLKKREQHPWRNDTFNLLKVTLLHGCFSRFLNCTNDTKSRNASPKNIYQKNLRTYGKSSSTYLQKNHKMFF